MCDKIGLKGRSATKKSHGTGPHQHADHHNDLKRINRLIGQLEGVKRMIEDRRYCIDILNQTKAVGSALRSLEGSILKDHMQHCLRHAMVSKNQTDANEKIAELVELFGKRPL